MNSTVKIVAPVVEHAIDKRNPVRSDQGQCAVWPERQQRLRRAPRSPHEGHALEKLRGNLLLAEAKEDARRLFHLHGVQAA